ncbi:MAG: 50S ribosomal protein L4 [Thermoguttaceae bacterium]
MATLPIYDRTGQQVGTYEIDPAELAPRISKQLLHDAVVMYEANRRQGTFQTKGRGDVAGTTRKMYRQKGTGNARAGSRRSPIRRGGGHTFAKRPRDFGYRLPKRALRLATRMALAARISDNEVKLIDELTLPAPKTKEMAAVLKALKIDGMRLLVAVSDYDPHVHKSARNLAGVSVLPVADLNALEVLRPRAVLMTRQALDVFRQGAARERQGA